MCVFKDHLISSITLPLFKSEFENHVCLSDEDWWGIIERNITIDETFYHYLHYTIL